MPTTSIRDVEIAVIGAGVAGVATAYYLCTEYQKRSVLLIDDRQPLSFTSAQSGDNYRNWWPHPVIVDFTNHSIDLMERIARDSANVLNMTRRGYAAATRRADIAELIAELHTGFGGAGQDRIRIHDGPSSKTYRPPVSADWTTAPDGVDVLTDQDLIRRTFPSFTRAVTNVLHVRRAGDIDSQAMGQYMLARVKAAGGQRLPARVRSIARNGRFMLDVAGTDGDGRVNADVVVNAAGPFAGDVAAMLDVDLPIENVFQQKLLFEDRDRAIPRDLPFSIDLDDPQLAWTTEEREFLAADPRMRWLAGPLPGGTHCRPQGSGKGQSVKLGWAYNRQAGEPCDDLVNDPHYDRHFPEIVLRAASALNPSLETYAESFPRDWTHYGGYYPMTRENWPLIGALPVDGAFVVGALSGFGSMAACAAGSICAASIAGGGLPGFAQPLSLTRYDDRHLMAEIENANTGIL